MNVILAVTNERFIAESFFSQFYPNNILQKILPNIGKSSGNVFAEWKTIVNGEEQNNWIPEDILTLDFNIVYVPYQGLAYIVHRERELNRIDDRFVIATMKETYQTPVITKELFNIILDTKYKSGFSIFRELFADMNSNILLGPDFDIVIDEIMNGDIALLSDKLIN